ncbi:MAG TPA: NAD-dependent epimerase/dehydratase family protein, partial [Sorangium sp.]|nr:NAD-dependent epimerase/dehydratase family protein [Sorangium sp.]
RANLLSVEDERFTLVEGDLDQLDLEALLSGVEVVFHEAGQPGVRGSWGRQFDVYLDRNIRATQRLLEAARSSASLRRFVYASSSSVYGDAERYPTLETDRPQPKSPYGVSKLAAEHLVSLYARNFGLPTTSLRYFTVYGPGQRPDMAFARFLRAAVRGEPIHVFGTGDQVRDFTFIDDVVEANVLAATVDHPAGSVFNVAGGSQASVNEVLEVIAGLVGRPLDVERSEVATGDVDRTSGSTDRIRSALGWSATTPLADGLRAHHRWTVEVGLSLPDSAFTWA